MAEEKRSKKEFIAKICCVLFAVALWLMVVGQNTDIQYEMTYYAVPVSITNAAQLSESSGLSIISGYDYNINITVRGNRAKLSNYTSEDISASIDVSDIVESGDYDLPVVISLPPSSGFSVVSKSLDTVKVSVDKLTSVEFDVNVNITNAQYNTDSYALGTPSVNPKKITVRGPQKVLQSIAEACVNLDLGNVTSNIGFNNRIILFDANGEEIDSPFISLSDQYAEGNVPFISIEEAQKIVEKSVPLVCAFKYGYYNSSNCSVSVSPEFVTLSGYENDLNKIQSLKVLTIDETKLTSSTVFTVSIEAPNGTTLINTKKTATITIKVSNNIDREDFDISEVEFENLNQDLMADIVSVQTITFRGESSLLADLKREVEFGEKKFVVSVDMSLITQRGTYKLPATVFITDSAYKELWCEYAEIYIDVNELY